MTEHKLSYIKCKPQVSGCCSTLRQIMKFCRTDKERRIIKLLWTNHGILTHELSEKFGCKSNNHHNLTQALNPRLIRMGWVISKYPAELHCNSWRWHLEPVHAALQKNIRKDLRRTIHKHMGAANDE